MRLVEAKQVSRWSVLGDGLLESSVSAILMERQDIKVANKLSGTDRKVCISKIIQGCSEEGSNSFLFWLSAISP